MPGRLPARSIFCGNLVNPRSVHQHCLSKDYPCTSVLASRPHPCRNLTYALLPGTLSSRRRQKSGTENPDHKACQQLGKSDPLSLALSHSDLKHLPEHSRILGNSSFPTCIYITFSHVDSFQRPDYTEFLAYWFLSNLFGPTHSTTPVYLSTHLSRDTHHQCAGAYLCAPDFHYVS